jgi:hypothetical protein
MSEENVKEVEEVKPAVELQEEKEAKEAAVLGTKDTEEAMKLGFAVAKVVKQAKENDGKFSSADLMLLTQLFPHFGPAFEGLDKIPAELKDLDEAEVKHLLNVAAAHLGGVLGKEELVRKVEKALKVALAIVDLVGEF